MGIFCYVYLLHCKIHDQMISKKRYAMNTIKWHYTVQLVENVFFNVLNVLLLITKHVETCRYYYVIFQTVHKTILFNFQITGYILWNKCSCKDDKVHVDYCQ